MPQMADITIKKADGTTDVVYSQANPSAGDKAPAVWKNKTVGTILAARPTFTLVAQDNGTGKARRIRSTYHWPKTRIDAATNVTVAGGASSESSHLIPQDMTPAEIEEYVAQYANLLASTLIKASLNEGYAPG
jgi:hypothetical protein